MGLNSSGSSQPAVAAAAAYRQPGRRTDGRADAEPKPEPDRQRSLASCELSLVQRLGCHGWSLVAVV